MTTVKIVLGPFETAQLYNVQAFMPFVAKVLGPFETAQL